MANSIDYAETLKQLESQRSLLEAELATAIKSAQMLRDPERAASGEQPAPPTRPVPEIVEDISRVDVQTGAIASAAREELGRLLDDPNEKDRLRIAAINELKSVLKGVVEPELPPTLHGEVHTPSHFPTDQVLSNVDAPSPVEALLVMGALAAGVISTKSRDAPPELPPVPPSPNAPLLDRTDAITQGTRPPGEISYEVPGSATFATQPAPIVAIEQRVVADQDPALKQKLDAIEQKFEAKREDLEQKIAERQQKFDERQSAKPPEEREVLQQKLDKQFDSMREDIDKSEGLERQRALEMKEIQLEQIERQRQWFEKNGDGPFGR